jgi:hypothetical protein
LREFKPRLGAASDGLSGFSLPPLRDVLAADLDQDGDTDLLAVSAAGRLPFLRNDGGNAHARLKVRAVA